MTYCPVCDDLKHSKYRFFRDNPSTESFVIIEDLKRTIPIMISTDHIPLHGSKRTDAMKIFNKVCSELYQENYHLKSMLSHGHVIIECVPVEVASASR